MEFRERFQKAAARAKVEWSPTEIGRSLGLAKQTVSRWMKKGEPSGETVFLIADKWHVDPRWLATGEGVMLPGKPVPEAVQPQEAELLASYRTADPRWRLSLRLLAALANEDQIEAATDVNVVVARILGKKPADVRYASNERVAAAFGVPGQHELARVQESTSGYKSGRTDKRKRQPVKKS